MPGRGNHPRSDSLPSEFHLEDTVSLIGGLGFGVLGWAGTPNKETTAPQSMNVLHDENACNIVAVKTN